MLDLSLGRTPDGKKRVIDVVLKQLIEFVRETMEEEDLLYVYEPESLGVHETRGNQISAIANFETDGYKIDLPYALKQTLYIIAAEDAKRSICLITDRTSPEQVSAIKKASKLNDKDDWDCRFLVIGIGSDCAP